jgi:uncharacterized membrane protein
VAQILIAYASTVLAFLIIDLAWLTVIARRFYVDQLGPLLLEKPNLVAAGAFYAVYVVGIIIFAVAPALRGGGVSTALVYGALFGLFAYGTYDMTNYATLKDWPLPLTVVDIVWGGFITSLAAVVGYHASQNFGGVA